MSGSKKIEGKCKEKKIIRKSKKKKINKEKKILSQ